MVTPRCHEGRVAIVTGSTRGIGAGIAKRFACEGGTVVVNGRSANDESETVEAIREMGGEVMFVEADMRDPAAIEALVETTVDRFGRIDVLVNNAGVQTETTATEATMDDWELVLETDFRMVFVSANGTV